MANLLGEMNQQLVNAYKEAKMADVPSVVPMAAGLEKVSDPTNLLALGENIRNVYATKKVAKTDEEGKIMRDTDGDIIYEYQSGAQTLREKRRPKVEQRKVRKGKGEYIQDVYNEGEDDEFRVTKYKDFTKEKKEKKQKETGSEVTFPGEVKERKFNRNPDKYYDQFITDIASGNEFREWLHENKPEYVKKKFRMLVEGKMKETSLSDESDDFDNAHMREAFKLYGYEFKSNSPTKYKTPFKKLTPLKQTDYQPMQQPEMTDSLANSLGQVASNNLTMANYIKNTGASLPMPYFNAIKGLNKQLIDKTAEDGSPDAMQTGVGVQNELGKLTEKEKELRMEVADMVINDEITNYRSEYMQTFVSEYMNPNKEVKVGMNPETGQYEFLWKSNLEDRFITEGEVRNNLGVFSKGVGSQTAVLKQVNSIIKSVGNPNTKQPDRSYFVSLASDIVKKGNKISKIHDDLLSNGSSFASDIDAILNNSTITSQLDPTPETELTENDMLAIKDIIINPENPNFNIKINPDDKLGVTDTLLIEYVAGYFEDQHGKVRGNLPAADKKGIMHYINKYKNKPKGFLANTIKRNNTSI